MRQDRSGRRPPRSSTCRVRRRRTVERRWSFSRANGPLPKRPSSSSPSARRGKRAGWTPRTRHASFSTLSIWLATFTGRLRRCHSVMNPFDLRGPEFLAFYLVFGLATLALLWLLRRAGEADTTSHAMLDDYVDIAYLRGGPQEAMRV